MIETMEAYYSVFRKYEYNDENLNGREQKLVNAAKNIIRDHEAKVSTYESNVEFLKTRVKNLQAEIAEISKPAFDPFEHSGQDLSSREKELFKANVSYKITVDELRSKLELAELTLGLKQRELEQVKEHAEKLRGDIETLVKDLGPVQLELESLRLENKKLKERIEKNDKRAQYDGEYELNENLNSLKMENQLLRDQLISVEAKSQEQHAKNSEQQVLLNWYQDVQMVLVCIILALVIPGIWKMLF
ncbi:unnamed protein product [Caenorhabditis brenneri]